MRDKDDLFHLIKAMSKSEKRYFTLDAKKSGKEGAKYLELFQAINAMETYEEGKLKKKFPRHLSSDKGYLYEAIMRSMRDYRSAKSKGAQIKERLMDSKYLYERGLYNQSSDRLFEAKVLAKELEDQFALLEINKEEHLSRYASKGRNKGYWEYLEQINLERKAILKAVLEEIKYFDLYFKLSMEVLREFDLKDEGKKEALKKWVGFELLEGKNKPTTAQAGWRYLQCHAMYYQLLGEFEKVHFYFSKVVEWWDNHPKYKEEEFFRYIIDFSNLLNACFKQKQHQHLIPGLIEKLENESPKNFHEQKTIFQKVSISKLLFRLNKGDFEGARILVPDIEKGLKKFSPKGQIVILINIAILFFVLKDYLVCIKWLNQVMKNLKTGERKDIQRMTRLLQLVSLYELGEIDKLENAFRASERFFKKQFLQGSSFESNVTTRLKRMFSAPLNDLSLHYSDFKNFLQSIKKRPKSEQPLGLDELTFWVEEKQ